MIYKEYQPEHEALLLAALMIDNAVYDELEMHEADFQLSHNRYLYSVISKIIERGETANLVTVSALIDPAKIKASYLSEITSKNFTAANVKFYADRIKAVAQRRKLEKLIMRMTEWVNTLDTDEVFDEIEKFLREESETQGESITQVRSRLMAYLEELESRMKNHRKIVGLSTGFAGLDIETGGFRDGEFIIIGARPSMGKTTLALNIARNMCTEIKVNIGFFSIETASSILIEKLLASEAGVNSRSLQTGEILQSDMSRLVNAASTLSGKVGDFWIDDTSGIKINTLRNRSRMLKRRGAKIIFVDYLTLINTERRDMARHEQIAEVSRSLKALARELMIPVVVLSQVRRETQGKMPTLADIRESGCLSGDTIVQRSDGCIAMESVNGLSNFAIHSHQDGKGSFLTQAKSCFKTGEKQTFTITLNTGHAISATGNHKFLTVGQKWINLEKLKSGDLVGLSIHEDIGKQQTMTNSELMFLGLFLGNGCALEMRAIQFTSNSKDTDLCEEMVNLSNIICNNELRPFVKKEIFRQGTSRESSAAVVYFPSVRVPARGYHNPIIAFLSKYGLFGKRSREKNIPIEIFSQPVQARRLFLKYLWAADGTICYSDGIKKTVAISYSTSCKDMALRLQILLQTVGIIASVVEYKRGKSVWYNIAIYSKLFKQKFMEEIGIAGKRKSDILNYCKEKNDKKIEGWTKYILSEDKTICYVPIKSIIPYKVEDVYDIEVPETHNFIANGFIVHNSIEQDSDVIIFLHREPNEELTKIDVAKNRNWGIGETELMFNRQYSRFESMVRMEG